MQRRQGRQSAIADVPDTWYSITFHRSFLESHFCQMLCQGQQVLIVISIPQFNSLCCRGKQVCSNAWATIYIEQCWCWTLFRDHSSDNRARHDWWLWSLHWASLLGCHRWGWLWYGDNCLCRSARCNWCGSRTGMIVCPLLCRYRRTWPVGHSSKWVSFWQISSTRRCSHESRTL